MEAPIFRVHRDRKGWGVQVKWPRSGDLWARHQRWPRWVWWGPFGDEKTRWMNGNDALWFANFCQKSVDETARTATAKEG